MKLTGAFNTDSCKDVTGTPEAVASFQKACALKDADGCLQLAARYQCGAGVARDVDRALHYNAASCELGEGAGCANVATLYLFGAKQDPAKALEFSTKGCDRGNAVACGYLGVIYWQGLGVAADAPRALKIFDEQCGRKSNMETCANEALLLYMGGPGVARDVVRAQHLADISCAADMQAGCNLLGGILLQQGGDANLDRAVQLFGKICDEGGGASCDNLGVIYRSGVGHIAPDLAKAKAQFQRACQLDNAIGCTHLGELGAGP
jgi:TPR repeat protein